MFVRSSYARLLPTLGLALCAASPAAWAGLVPAGLSISGTVTLDTAFSLAAVGGGTQSGTLRSVLGGTTTSSNFGNNPALPGTASQGGSFGAAGDGIGALFSMSGNGAGAQTDGLFLDYTLNLLNSSVDRIFVITFSALIENGVSASGRDAFAFSDVSFRDAANAELVFSDHRVDTLNPANTFDADSPTHTFSVTLAPGQSASFSALQRQRGGSFSSDGSYNAVLDAFLRLDSIDSRGGDNDVPLPATLPLLALGLMLMSVSRRRAA